jgi:hypothetical protein
LKKGIALVAIAAVVVGLGFAYSQHQSKQQVEQQKQAAAAPTIHLGPNGKTTNKPKYRTITRTVPTDSAYAKVTLNVVGTQGLIDGTVKVDGRTAAADLKVDSSGHVTALFDLGGGGTPGKYRLQFRPAQKKPDFAHIATTTPNFNLQEAKDQYDTLTQSHPFSSGFYDTNITIVINK